MNNRHQSIMADQRWRRLHGSFGGKTEREVANPNSKLMHYSSRDNRLKIDLNKVVLHRCTHGRHMPQFGNFQIQKPICLFNVPVDFITLWEVIDHSRPLDDEQS
jgi:hypothetical protein